MFLDYVLIVFAIILFLLGFAGCVLPIIPGPPIAWLSMLLLKFTSFSEISWNLIIVLALVTIVVTVLDYIFPAWITKKMGGSSWGVWGTVIGIVFGLIFLGPIGVILGPFLGAFVGEIIGNKQNKNLNNNPWRSALGSLLGFTLGTGIKLFSVGVMLYFFIKDLWPN
ncbi:DUF456 domain-containing protein [Tenuifilum thalassicum]|jgi:hypothetical protein|uniref:DUF456 domain-containing protein n=1 Tax=Tenuifilum thalassicum TaxID=2590900 RepID=A0A7D3XFY9_9BACT|nr:DUF456 domain-containing protein [Tenuifilum thalassicum]QKG79757.1 DUF456 domain-containing protein [Tenuifilum thalassicum]